MFQTEQTNIFVVFQYEDTTTLPTKLRFNVTVSHAAVSNSDAYRVKLSGGNQHQQIFWTERGPNEGPKPWDSELTVTDDVFWIWSQNALGRSLKELLFIYYYDVRYICGETVGLLL